MVQTQPKYKQKNTLFIVSSSTGKERDSETGFSYFGARYYDSDLMTGWLSVDPLADKYPNLSPYAYCAWNPIRLVDPDGRDWYRCDETGSVLWSNKNDKKIEISNSSYRNIGTSHKEYRDGVKYSYGNSPIPESIDFIDPNLNLKGGQFIPDKFITDDGTEVSVLFNIGSDNAIDKNIISILITGVNEANNMGAEITSLNISSTTDHSSNKTRSAHSLHNGARGIDISMINNIPINSKNEKAKLLQNSINKTKGWLENYGPFIIQKMNQGTIIEAPWARTCCADGHNRHIHLSSRKK